MTEDSTLSARSSAEILVLLAAMPPEHLEGVLANLATALPSDRLIVASPDALPAAPYPQLQIVPVPETTVSWTLTASDFVNGYQLAEKHKASAILILGPGFGLLDSATLHALANAVLSASADLAVPSYQLPANAGLVNSAILYPLTRALFASRVRFPLAVDLGLSPRMAERLAASAHRFTASNQGDALLWPLNEASVAGFSIVQFDAGPRVPPSNSVPDLNTVLPAVAGSLFSDIDLKAAFWQRPRLLPPAPNATFTLQALFMDATTDIAPMIHNFQLGYANLYEIWSLVLPPQSLLGLKRLAAMDAAVFRMPDTLWARIVFDFVLAYRLRTINRGHLLGALIPLYLAWVASHFNLTASGTDPETHIESVAAAFEADKAYLVSRWRWPDRFNP
jgi:hypothetical protein